MGNTQRIRNSDLIRYIIEVDQPEKIYQPNDIISGNVLHSKDFEAYVSLTGIVSYNKRKRKTTETCKIIFFSLKYDFITSPTRQKFQFQLHSLLPPTLNNSNIYPNISYSINLVYKKTKDLTYASIPIQICPIIEINQPALLTPLFFGPIENKIYHTKLEVKVNRSVFKFNDTAQIFYELKNPMEEFIYKINVSLGFYSLVESNVWQQDICDGIETCFSNIPSKLKLLRNKVLLTIPNKIYLPPSIQYKYSQDNDQNKFDLTIEYKIQFKIYLNNQDNLWQVDIPIILCNDITEQTDVPRISETNFV